MERIIEAAVCLAVHFNAAVYLAVHFNAAVCLAVHFQAAVCLAVQFHAAVCLAVHFHITSWRTSATADAERLIQHIAQALEDVKLLLAAPSHASVA